MLTQLHDIKKYLVDKIETRFKELEKEVSRNVRVKKRAIEDRKSTLDRFHVQVKPIIPLN